MKIAISPGHGTKIRGAAGPEPWGLDEVDEAQSIVPIIARYMRDLGAEVEEIVDHYSTSQDQNLDWLVDEHNAAFNGNHGDDRLDVSVHYNAYQVTTTQPRGTEVWYYSQDDLARAVASEIAMASGLIDRGGKQSSSLYFLSNTICKSILIEVAFVDSKPDCDSYRRSKEQIAESIANTIVGEADLPGRPDRPPRPEPPPVEDALLHVTGRCSWFGGPSDTGVAPDESLAFIYEGEEDQFAHLFLSNQPTGTSGLARKLDPDTCYVACRWDYQVTSKEMLRDQTRKALVRANGKEILCYPADWGPHEQETGGRVCDLSPKAMQILGLMTDDSCEVIYPAPQG
jgi:hypothetical protein